MPEWHNWVERNLLEPYAPGIGELEDTYPWKRFLSNIQSTKFHRALLPEVRGAIFTGPVGNGRHTQAFAYAYTLMEQNLKKTGDFSGAGMIMIEPVLLPPTLEIQVLKDRVDELYDELTKLMKYQLDTAVVIFDQIDLYPRRIMDQIAEKAMYRENEKLFTLCIGQNESKNSRNHQRALIHCRCPNPTAEQRDKYLQKVELIQVEDTWTDLHHPKQKNIAVEFEEITMEEIVNKTEGCSYADLEDLIWMLKLVISNFDVEQFQNRDHVMIRISRKDVLEAINLCRATSEEESLARLIAVPQQGNLNVGADLMEDLSFEDDMDWITNM